VIPILSVVGRSNSGKTTLLEKLLRELTRRGVRVGTVKHHVHGPVTVDVPGKDSWRHKQAGAVAVVLASRSTAFLVRDTDAQLPLELIAHRYLDGVDLVLTEGFRSGTTPKIEVNRAVLGIPPLCGPDDDLVAMVSDRETGLPVPHFGLEDVAPLADFLESRFLRPASPERLDLLVGGRRVRLDPQTATTLLRVVWSLVGDGREPEPTVPVELRIRERTP
jgi:molybdopterin-guanine dinucleotide biosynthesis protein B